MKMFSVLLVLVLAAGALFAQGASTTRTPATTDSGTLMVNTAKGLFVLRAGVLAKYNTATMKQSLLLQFWGPMPEAPADFSNRDALTKYFTEVQRRLAPSLLLAKDNSLLVVVGDGFARFNQDTLKPEAMTDLRVTEAAPAADANSGNRFGGMRQTEPSLGHLLVDNTLYLMRAKEIIAINTTDGKILNRAELPKELQGLALSMPNFTRGGGNNGGGNRGGGAPAAAPANP